MYKLILILSLTILASCTRTVYLPVENYSVVTDTVYRSTVVDRTIIERDTVSTYLQGDTVVREVTRWRIREISKTDTVYKAHTDTVRIKEPYPVEVTKQSNWVQRIGAEIGNVILFFLAAVILVGVMWLARKILL